MSRAGGGAAAALPATTSPTLHHLVVHNTGGSATALVRSEPFGISYPTDFAALVMLASLAAYPAPSEGRVNTQRKQKLDELQQQVQQKKTTRS